MKDIRSLRRVPRLNQDMLMRRVAPRLRRHADSLDAKASSAANLSWSLAVGCDPPSFSMDLHQADDNSSFRGWALVSAPHRNGHLRSRR